MLAWNIGFRICRLTRASGVRFLVPAEYFAVMCGAFPGTCATWQWLRLSTIYCCALRPWSRTDVILTSLCVILTSLTLDLLITDVSDFARVTVVAPQGSSDHSSLSVAISTAQDIPNLCVSRRVLLKHRVNWLQFVKKEVSSLGEIPGVLTIKLRDWTFICPC